MYGWDPHTVSNTWTPEQLVLMLEAAQENRKDEAEMYSGENSEEYNDSSTIPRMPELAFGPNNSSPKFSRKGKHSDLAAGVLQNFLQRSGFLQKGE